MSGRILVLGGTGVLGRAVQSELTRLGRPFDAPTRAELDLIDTGTIGARLDALAPAAVVNLAAFTDVAGAERPANAEAVIALNVELPAALARASARLAVPWVHVSTDYVFDGVQRRPYLEDDPVDPLQVYGASKLEGERAAIARNPHTLILRVSTLFGPGRPQRAAYVDAILAQARARAAAGGGTIEVVEPPVSSPTYAPDVAPALVELLDRGAEGIFHVVNDGAASRLELASAVVRLSGIDGVAVRPRAEPAGALMRPAYSVLDTSKLAKTIGRKLPPW
jgi:dTDP-4-dehydrorhamnose reductase